MTPLVDGVVAAVAGGFAVCWSLVAVGCVGLATAVGGDVVAPLAVAPDVVVGAAIVGAEALGGAEELGPQAATIKPTPTATNALRSGVVFGCNRITLEG